MRFPDGRSADGVVELVPVTAILAEHLLEGCALGLVLGEGWPHEDSASALGHVVRGAGAEMWLVVSDGLVVGDCGIHGPPDAAGAVEIGYGLAAPARGRGIGRVVVQMLVERLVSNGVRRVVARTRPENGASRRVLELNGFVLVDDDRGYLRYEHRVFS